MSRSIQDELIDRGARRFDNAAATEFLRGKCVLVTGAGGTIGAGIVRQAAAAGARRVLMVERCENALYHVDRTMRETASGVTVPLMLDAGDRERMRELIGREKPEVVLHAAAYKHVPMVELNPEEGWKNNLETTKTLAEECAAGGVARFVLISTDKAVNPKSVMGKTKLAAERFIMSCNQTFATPTPTPTPTTTSTPTPTPTTSFCAVRFGNVFGSSGSVVEVFREQIAARRPVTVTHPDMRRYFMTVDEAVSLVLQAASREERAIYTLDMGKPVRIVELAERMIAEAGYRPYDEIPIVFTGIRPGEKLFEEIDVSEKNFFKTDMAKIYITKGE